MPAYGLFTTKNCHCCGKEIIYNENWAYKRGSNAKRIYFCSYKSMREYDKKIDVDNR